MEPWVDESPIALLSSSSNFSKLYQLLDDNKTKEKAWSIIEKLPSNQSVLKNIEILALEKKMDDNEDDFTLPASWKELFQQSEYKYLYSIKLILGIIKKEITVVKLFFNFFFFFISTIFFHFNYFFSRMKIGVCLLFLLVDYFA